MALAISVLYELIEWWTSLARGAGATDFLGARGEPWDTLSDMFMALIGTTVGLLWLARLLDRQIAALR